MCVCCWLTGDVYEFDDESEEAHDEEADGGGQRNLPELLGVRLGASIDQPNAVGTELTDGQH